MDVDLRRCGSMRIERVQKPGDQDQHWYEIEDAGMGGKLRALTPDDLHDLRYLIDRVLGDRP